ncbi:hypothetical protein C440_17041 [Haloferax mucosum ATCC BAA-1512]|uniref:CARDB domain-containing protein n=1 Tax=Haloferax mucosum ATCC BAA-1512 TaxID=662479 RepID=M0I093_9EURY|nr:hypothetical protein [Haloferax mucosum]ELZ90131.1 hypothetical protein C440_17041 [Haloferax mucosum ATCC BAA-1512]
MKRRQYLGALGALTISSTSGCATVQSAVRSGPPYFENVEISGPSEVSVGDEFDIEITAKNTGGKKGDFTATLSTGKGAFTLDQSVRIEDVQVTKSKTTTIEDIYSDYATELTYRITDYDARHSVSVKTKGLELGETFETHDGHSIAVNGVGLEKSVFLNGESKQLLSANPGNVIVLVYFTIGYEGDDERPFTSDEIVTTAGSFISESSLSTYTFDDIAGVRKEHLDLSEIEPGVQKSGWMMFEVPYSELETLGVVWDRVSTGVPEVKWNLDAGDVPIFDAEATVPDEVEIGTTGTITLEVENTGDASGTYRYGMWRTGEYDSSQSVLDEITVEPGTTETVELDVTQEHIGSYEYEILPVNETTVVEFVPPTRTVGNSYVNPDGVRITPGIGALNFDGFSDTYAYETYDGSETVRASSGKKFLFVSIDVEHTDGSSSLPHQDDFSVDISGLTYDVVETSVWGETRFVSPRSGVEYDSFSSPKESQQWLLYEVPASTQQGDVVLRYRDQDGLSDDTFGADWTVDR